MRKPPPAAGQTPGLAPGRSVTPKPSPRSTPTRPPTARPRSGSPTPAWLAFGAIGARTFRPRRTSSAGSASRSPRATAPRSNGGAAGGSRGRNAPSPGCPCCASTITAKWSTIATTTTKSSGARHHTQAGEPKPARLRPAGGETYEHALPQVKAAMAAAVLSTARLSIADQLLERGFVADGIQVGVVLCGIAKLRRHLDAVPEVIERVTRPARKTLAAGEVVEQHGVLRSGCDQGA